MFKFSAKFVLLLIVSTNFNVGFLGITQAQAATLLLGISTTNRLLQKVTDNYLSHSHLSKSKTLSSIQSIDRTIKSQSKQENLGVDSKNIVKQIQAKDSNNKQSNAPQIKDLPSAKEINRNIQNRYQQKGLDIDTEETVSLIESNQLFKSQGLLEESAIIEQNLLADSNSYIIQEAQPDYFLRNTLFAFIGVLSASSLLLLTNKSLRHKLQAILSGKLGKSTISESTIFLHNRALEETRIIASKMQAVDNDKLNNKEFIFYLKIKISLSRGEAAYKHLTDAALMLEAALVAQNSFLKLEQTELRFRSRKQQEFYSYITQLLTEKLDKSEFQNKVKDQLDKKIESQNKGKDQLDRSPVVNSEDGKAELKAYWEKLDKSEFQNKVKDQLDLVLPLVNSEDGKAALKAYWEELKKVSEYDLGLKLLALFKQYNLTDFSILIKISGLISQMQGKDLLNLKTIVSLVISQYEIFEKLAPIIGVSEDRSTPDNYAKILQYIGLTHRHEVAYGKFQELVVMLKQWQKPYRSIVGIRSEYDPNEYYLPQEFTEEIPGLNIFNKYESYF